MTAPKITIAGYVPTHGPAPLTVAAAWTKEFGSGPVDSVAWLWRLRGAATWITAQTIPADIKTYAYRFPYVGEFEIAAKAIGPGGTHQTGTQRLITVTSPSTRPTGTIASYTPTSGVVPFVCTATWKQTGPGTVTAVWWLLDGQVVAKNAPTDPDHHYVIATPGAHRIDLQIYDALGLANQTGQVRTVTGLPHPIPPDPTPPDPIPPIPPGPSTGLRPGHVRPAGSHGWQDDAGRHYYGGVSLFWAPWGFTNDRPLLDAALTDLGPGQYDLARLIGHITGPSPWWDNRHNDLTQPGAVERLGQCLDYLAAHGLRSWLVLFGDVSYTPAVRSRIVDDVIAMLRVRQDYVCPMEVVNEGLQLKPTQFPLAEAQGYAKRIKSALPQLMVLVTNGASETCADLKAVSVGDCIAPHFSRATTGTKGVWTPVAQPWMGDTQPRWCAARATLDGEPIGLGSSGTSENDPTRLAMERAVNGSGGSVGDIFHSAAGVYGRVSFASQTNFAAAQESVRQMRALINSLPTLQDWSRGGSTAGPFTVRDFPDDSHNKPGTIDRLYCAWNASGAWCAALNVKALTTLTAKQPMHVSVRHGARALTEVRAVDLHQDESMTLNTDTPGAVLVVEFL